MKILVAPDSFKGSLSAPDAAAAMADGIRRVCPHAEILLMPLADGGEGTRDALVQATSGRQIAATVAGPLGEPTETAWGLLGGGLGDGQTAVVEMASAAGLLLISPQRRDPRRTTTYGVGELLQRAAESGVSKIIVGLGGSATNDGGAGAMQALGVRFLDNKGQDLPEKIGGAALGQIARIDLSQFRFPLGRVKITAASDVTNPLIGPQGASAVFGPQKGADAAAVAELDAALTHYAGIIKRDLGRDIAAQPGAGAAGGLGAALMAFLDAEMSSGIDIVLDAAGFEARAQGADFVFTGEGRIDSQTAQGKTISGLLKRCGKLGNVPVIAFGGTVEDAAADDLAALGLLSAFSIVPGPLPLDEAMRNGYALLASAAARVTRLLCR